MKTPRELLLDRHASVEPQLNAIRRRALASVSASRPAPVRRTFQRVGLRDLLAPWPRQALALVAAWIVIGLLNRESGSSNLRAHAAQEPTTPPQSFLARLHEHRRQLRELLPPEPESPAPPATRSFLFHHRRPTSEWNTV